MDKDTTNKLFGLCIIFPSGALESVPLVPAPPPTTSHQLPPAPLLLAQREKILSDICDPELLQEYRQRQRGTP